MIKILTLINHLFNMKIGHVFYSLNYGGIETLIVNISNWQILNNHNVHVIIINEQPINDLVKFIDSRVKIININRKLKSRNIIDLLYLNYYLIINNYNVIHLHAAAIGNFLLPIFKSKILLHIHETLNISSVKIPKFNKCITISDVVKNRLTDIHKIKNVSTIYSGIDFNSFKQKEKNSILNRIVCIGNLTNSVKNQSYIIKEFSKISDTIGANLYLIGTGEDYSFYLELIKNLELKERVFLLGSKSQKWIKNNLCNYDLFIQASLSEGLGLTPIEASAASLPMILSSIEGHLEVSENGKYCKLFNPHNEGELSNLILDLYNNYSYYFDISVENRNYHKNKFDFENFNKKLIKEYKKIKLYE